MSMTHVLKMEWACEGLIVRGPNKGQAATGTPAGYQRHYRVGEDPCVPCREANNEASRLYKSENPAAVKLNRRLYYEANAELIRDKSRRWSDENRDRKRESVRKWREFNAEWVKEYQRQYVEENPDKKRGSESRRRARKFGCRHESFSHAEIFERDLWVCQLCFEPVDRSISFPGVGSATLEHLLPLSRGGHHTKVNSALAHHGCNSRKGNMTIDEWRKICR